MKAESLSSLPAWAFNLDYPDNLVNRVHVKIKKSKKALLTLLLMSGIPLLSHAAELDKIATLLSPVKLGEPWDKDMMFAAKASYFKITDTGGNSVAKLTLHYYTNATCSNPMTGTYSTPDEGAEPLLITQNKPFGLVATSAWLVGQNQLSIDMNLIQSIAISFFNSTTAEALQSGFTASDNSPFACIPVSCSEGQCTATDGSALPGGAKAFIYVDIALQSNLSTLALSVKNTGLNPALTGNARQLTITNTGSTTATNVQVTTNSFPTGTTVDSSDCETIAGNGGTCVITITPGADASNNCNTAGTVPSSTLTISANGRFPNTVNVDVIGYGCQYQGGYVFAIDDTTNNGVTGACTAPPCTGSIGGTVVSLTDQAPRADDGVLWSSNGTINNAAYDAIYGISHTSTTSDPVPDSGQVPDQNPCNGNSDGSCNTNNIYVYYQNNATNAPITLAYYATGRCKAYQGSGFTDWYLPAICEMGPASPSPNAGCVTNNQNISSNIPGLLSSNTDPDNDCPLGSNCLYGKYWSSTQNVFYPQGLVWYQNFISGGGSAQNLDDKSILNGVRCTRTF